MANYTEHYGLHQWVPEDDFLRTDFNTDFALIDAALAGLAAADGAESAARSQEDGELSAAITAGDNAQATALASAKAALQNAITSGDNAQASALAAAKTALQNSIAALDAAKAEIVVGTYMGNGQPEQVINLGFTPLAVLFEDECGQRSDNGYYRYTGLLVPNHTFDMGRITTNGFVVAFSYDEVHIMANVNNAAYYYLALRPTA